MTRSRAVTINRGPKRRVLASSKHGKQKTIYSCIRLEREQDRKQLLLALAPNRLMLIRRITCDAMPVAHGQDTRETSRLRYEFDGPGGAFLHSLQTHPTEARQSAIRPAEAHQPSNQAYRCSSVLHGQRTEGGLRCSTRVGHFFARCYFTPMGSRDLDWRSTASV